MPLSCQPQPAAPMLARAHPGCVLPAAQLDPEASQHVPAQRKAVKQAASVRPVAVRLAVQHGGGLKPQHVQDEAQALLRAALQLAALQLGGAAQAAEHALHALPQHRVAPLRVGQSQHRLLRGGTAQQAA